MAEDEDLGENHRCQGRCVNVVGVTGLGCSDKDGEIHFVGRCVEVEEFGNKMGTGWDFLIGTLLVAASI